MTIDFLPQVAFTFMLIFARVGTMAMVLPTLGERTVPGRIRLALALAFTLVMYPSLSSAFAALPPGLFAALGQVVVEVITGLFIGLSARLVMSATQVAGTVIAMQTGLGFAQNVDPSQGVQSALFASFMNVAALTLVVVADLHHLLIAAIYRSYAVFAPGTLVPVADFAQLALKTVAGSFSVAVQISAPFLVFGLIFYLGIGVLSRLMPQVQIFFLAMPVNILVGFILFMLLLSLIMTTFLNYFEATVSRLLG